MSVTQQQNRVHQLPGTADPRIAFFDRRAPAWDDNANDVARTLARLDTLKDRLGLCAGLRVLELGCGTGRVTGWLADAVRPCRVTAVDFSTVMLAQARQRGLPVEFRLMDICGQIAIAERFDRVFCFNAFPHFRDQAIALKNIRRLLNPGGRLVILHLTGSARLNAFHAALAHPVCHDLMPSADIWPARLVEADLKLVSLTDDTDLFLLHAKVSDTAVSAA